MNILTAPKHLLNALNVNVFNLNLTRQVKTNKLIYGDLARSRQGWRGEHAGAV